MDNLKPSAPTFRLGRRTLALEQRTWKNEAQLGLVEVVPEVDPFTLKLTGWKPVFKGLRVSARPAEFRDFLEGVLLVLRRADVNGGPLSPAGPGPVPVPGGTLGDVASRGTQPQEGGPTEHDPEAPTVTLAPRGKRHTVTG